MDRHGTHASHGCPEPTGGAAGPPPARRIDPVQNRGQPRRREIQEPQAVGPRVSAAPPGAGPAAASSSRASALRATNGDRPGKRRRREASGAACLVRFIQPPRPHVALVIRLPSGARLKLHSALTKRCAACAPTPTPRAERSAVRPESAGGIRRDEAALDQSVSTLGPRAALILRRRAGPRRRRGSGTTREQARRDETAARAARGRGEEAAPGAARRSARTVSARARARAPSAPTARKRPRR